MLQKLKIIGLIGFALVMAAVIYYKQGTSSPANVSGRNVVFTVSQGEGVEEIGKNLRQAGLIKSTWLFNIYIWLNHRQSVFMAGDYSLNPSLNIKKIVGVITSGKVLINEDTIKIIEGWRIKEIDDYLTKNKFAVAANFNVDAANKIGSWKFNFAKPDFLSDAPAAANIEGYLFPDTYRVFKNAASQDLIEKMLNNFAKKLTPDMRQDIAKQGRSIYEVVIMASLIEKEVKTAEDMKIVSGIFWQRLKIGQPLQLDATLSYVLNDNKPSHSLIEIKTDSSYNTYKYKGLPPGPICNPGLNALKAAIYPLETDYNYFLNKPDTGETVFSKTLAEHNINKYKYLK